MSIQFAGGTIVNATFTATTKVAIQSNVVTQLLAAGWSQATGPSGGGTQTVTLSIASPGVVTLAAHGYLVNDLVYFTTTGALPSGISAGTLYYVKTILSSSTFTISSTAGGAAINFTGTQSGTQSIFGTIRMATATTPWSVTSRVKMQDNGGSCLTFSIENSTSTIGGGNSTSNGGYLIPQSSVSYRIIADMYQAFIFTPATTGNRAFVAFGTPYLPTFLQGVLTECGWLQCNAYSDSNGTLYPSLRTGFASTGTSNQNYANVQGVANTNVLDLGSGSNYTQSMSLVLPVLNQRGLVGGQNGLDWSDGSAMMIEPLIAWPTSSSGGQALIRGQLWDTVIVMAEFPGDTTTTFDGHNWWGITDTDNGDYATLFVAVT